jgi:hypothetical protein
MAQLTASRIMGAIYGLFSGLDATDEEMLKQVLYYKKARVYLSDLATAGTAQTETGFFVNDTGVSLRLVSAKLIGPIAVTAADATMITFTVTKRDAAGINPAVVATASTNLAGGSLVAFLPKVLTKTVANAVILNGWGLTVLASKTGAGTAFTAATSQAYIEVTLEPIT